MKRRYFLKQAQYTTLSSIATLSILQQAGCTQEVEEDAETTPMKSSGNLSLKDVAASRNKLYGSAISSWHLEQDPDYGKLLARECSIATPENELKWDLTEPEPGKFDFSRADIVTEFCRKHNIKLRGHNLFWHEARPSWLAYPPPIDAFTRHCQVLMDRYRNNPMLVSWDVINEPIAPNENETDDRTHGLRKGLTPELVRDYLSIAASIDRSKEFVLNEIGVEETGWKQDHFLQLLEYLKSNNVKLDSIGIQSHLLISVEKDFDWQGFSDLLTRINDLNLKVIITEFDILMTGKTFASSSEIDILVADQYKRYLDICFEHGVNTIVTWGLTDKYTWYRNLPWVDHIYQNNKSLIRPLPFDENLQKKLAKDAIFTAFYES